jgi:hypothetical protein
VNVRSRKRAAIFDAAIQASRCLRIVGLRGQPMCDCLFA